MLQTVKLSFQCPVRWSSMVGDDRARFCGRCERNVFNLSAMTQSAAAALIQAHQGNLCVRFYRRDDGKLVTADCPPPSWLERWRYRLRSVGEADGRLSTLVWTAVAVLTVLTSALALIARVSDRPVAAAPKATGKGERGRWVGGAFDNNTVY